MAEFPAAPQSGPLPVSTFLSTTTSISTTTSSPSGSLASASDRRASASPVRSRYAGPTLVGPDEPWASGQRKRYLNSLQTSELAA